MLAKKKPQGRRGEYHQLSQTSREFICCVNKHHEMAKLLREYNETPGYMRDACLLMQDDFKASLQYFGIE